MQESFFFATYIAQGENKLKNFFMNNILENSNESIKIEVWDNKTT